MQVADSQMDFIATNQKSLAEAQVDSALHPFAIYDESARGHLVPPVPMIGFAMYEIRVGVGFILRIMIDRQWQGRGYGRAAVIEMIRRLRLYPEVEMIATSHRSENIAIARLFESLGFVPWELDAEDDADGEVYLMLDEASAR